MTDGSRLIVSKLVVATMTGKAVELTAAEADQIVGLIKAARRVVRHDNDDRLRSSAVTGLQHALDSFKLHDMLKAALAAHNRTKDVG